MVYIVGEGGANDPERLQLTTKLGTPIRAVRRKPLHPTVMAARVDTQLQQWEGISLRSRSSDYNCVGLVMASRRGWIDIDDLHQILEEDGYRSISEKEVAIGDLVVYFDAHGPAHVGVVHTHEPNVEHATWTTTVLSQWGEDGEYFHKASEVPVLFGKPKEFWTDRVL